MARTTATNFSGGLQFPYANAATDPFHKEDIQTLAIAVDQHDHSTGKGLVLGSGVITTPMLAPNSASVAAGYLGAPANTTTSTTMVAIPSMTVTFTTGANTADLLVWWTVPVYNSITANSTAAIGLKLDSGTVLYVGYVGTGATFVTTQISGAIMYAGPYSGSHTIAGYWLTAAGTLNQQTSAQTTLFVLARMR